DVEGCTVHVTTTGIVDTSGDLQALNSLVARRALVIDAGGQLRSARNTVTLPPGVALPAGGFTPPLAPTDVTQQPFCTAIGQPDCRVPCPTCGDLSVQLPEPCDPAQPNDCCDATCRAPFCDDFNPCTTDTCLVPGGCTHTTIPGCTTTTTTTIHTTTTRPPPT